MEHLAIVTTTTTTTTTTTAAAAAFPRQIRLANAPQYYVILALPVLLYIIWPSFI